MIILITISSIILCMIINIIIIIVIIIIISIIIINIIFVLLGIAREVLVVDGAGVDALHVNLR